MVSIGFLVSNVKWEDGVWNVGGDMGVSGERYL